jgi:hypothetical protein
MQLLPREISITKMKRNLKLLKQNLNLGVKSNKQGFDPLYSNNIEASTYTCTQQLQQQQRQQ